MEQIKYLICIIILLAISHNAISKNNRSDFKIANAPKLENKLLYTTNSALSEGEFLLPFIESQLRTFTFADSPKKQIFSTVENFAILNYPKKIRASFSSYINKNNHVGADIEKSDVSYKIDSELITYLLNSNYYLEININKFNSILEYEFILFNISKKDDKEKHKNVNKPNQLPELNYYNYRFASVFINPDHDDYKEKLTQSLKQLISEATSPPIPVISFNDKNYSGNDSTIYIESNKTNTLSAFTIDHDCPQENIKLQWKDIYRYMNEQDTIGTISQHIDNKDKVQNIQLDSGKYYFYLSASDGINNVKKKYTIYSIPKASIGVNNVRTDLMEKLFHNFKLKDVLTFNKNEAVFDKYSFTDNITNSPDDLYIFYSKNYRLIYNSYHFNILTPIQDHNNIDFYYYKKPSTDSPKFTKQKLSDTTGRYILDDNEYYYKYNSTSTVSDPPYVQLYKYNYEIRPKDIDGYFVKKIPLIDKIMVNITNKGIINTQFINIHYHRLHKASFTINTSLFSESYNHHNELYAEVQAGISFHLKHFTLYSMVGSQSRNGLTDYYLNYKFDKFTSLKEGVLVNLIHFNNSALLFNYNIRYAPVYDNGLNYLVNRILQNGVGLNFRFNLFNNSKNNFLFNPFMNYYVGRGTTTDNTLYSFELGFRFDILFEKKN